MYCHSFFVTSVRGIGELPTAGRDQTVEAALSATAADGLLLTIANALSHDLYYKMIDPNAPTSRRVAISKALLLSRLARWVGAGGNGIGRASQEN